MKMSDMKTMTQNDLDQAATFIDMTANSHPSIAEASEESIERPANGGLYNDANLGCQAKSVYAPTHPSLLMQATQLKNAAHKPPGGRTNNKMMLFEVDDRIGFHADSASHSIQTAKKTKQRPSQPRGSVLASGQQPRH